MTEEDEDEDEEAVSAQGASNWKRSSDWTSLALSIAPQPSPQPSGQANRRGGIAARGSLPLPLPLPPPCRSLLFLTRCQWARSCSATIADKPDTQYWWSYKHALMENRSREW